MRACFHQNRKYASVLALFSKDNIFMLASKNLLSYRHAQANALVVYSEERLEYILFLTSQGAFGRNSDAEFNEFGAAHGLLPGVKENLSALWEKNER